MFTRSEVQAVMDKHTFDWGTCGYPDWLYIHRHATPEDVIKEGVKHGCPVIPLVVNRDRTPVENCEAYALKRYSFSAVGDTLATVGRDDLHQDWNSTEVRKDGEQTDASLRDVVMYPSGVDPRVLPACNRTAQVLYADLFRNLAVASDGQRQDLATSRQEQDKFVLPLKGLSKIAENATSIADFTASFAAHATQTLISSGIDSSKVLNFLVGSVAKPSLIKETGQRQPSVDMVNSIADKLDNLSGLAEFSSNFRRQGLMLLS